MKKKKGGQASIQTLLPPHPHKFKNLIRNVLASRFCGVPSRVTERQERTQPANIISVRQLRPRGGGGTHIYTYIYIYASPQSVFTGPIFSIHSAGTNKTLLYSLSLPPPLATTALHLRFIDFTIYHMSRWERSSLHLNHGANMRVIYCFRNPGADLVQLHFSWALLLLAEREQLQFRLIKL